MRAAYSWIFWLDKEIGKMRKKYMQNKIFQIG